MLFSTVSALLSVFDPKAPYIVPSIWWVLKNINE